MYNHKVEIYKMEEIENELGERETRGVLKNSAYCKIIPLNNKRSDEVGGVDVNRHALKFVFRALSVKGIGKDWYILYKGKKYDVVHFYEDFKYNRFVEVFVEEKQE